MRASRAAPLLREIGVMNADGSISADMRRKFKQVNHALSLMRPDLEAAATRARRPVVVDLNCGASYLGFVVDHYLRHELGVMPEFLGVDRDPSLVDSCRRRAGRLGATHMKFVCVETADAPIAEPPDILLSLHGCDTATDDAIARAVRADAAAIYVAPCCQHEVRRLLRPDGAFAAFTEGVAAEEFSAVLTDVLRVLALRAAGWHAELIEFVPLEHTAKNRLIRARRGGKPDASAQRELARLTAELSAPPRCSARL